MLPFLFICALAVAFAGCRATGGGGSGSSLDAPSSFDASELDPEQLAAEMTRRMDEKLGLSDAQEDRVAAINLRYAYELKDIAMGEGGRRAKAREMRSMQSRKESELKEVFEPAQYEAYLEIKAELREQMKARMS
jgi:hypothetical protein